VFLYTSKSVSRPPGLEHDYGPALLSYNLLSRPATFPDDSASQTRSWTSIADARSEDRLVRAYEDSDIFGRLGYTVVTGEVGWSARTLLGNETVDVETFTVGIVRIECGGWCQKPRSSATEIAR
jgi:hypothetical protein